MKKKVFWCMLAMVKKQEEFMENTPNKKIKIFFADNSKEDLLKITKHFESNANYEIVGSETDAKQTLEMLSTTEVDILVMDIMLGGMDGFEFMEKAKSTLGSKMPKLMIASCLSHSGFVNKALSLGAEYYMIKPLDFKVLENRITDIFSFNSTMQTKQTRTENKALDEKISNIFLTVGIPAHIKGYQFLREAIKMAIEKPEIVSSITKELYPSIAEKFQTSSSKVERAIRHAIEVAWNRGKIENINSIFGIKVYNQNEKPTNGEFIALVADKMLMEGF